jgi:Domain of unknown function (DUF4347)/FG-GAP-like repeat
MQSTPAFGFSNQAATALTTDLRATDNNKSVLFIDSGVQSAASLTSQVTAGTSVYVLDANQDAVAQMTQVLSGMSGVDSVQIASHGRNGGLQLGQSWLAVGSLPSYVAQLKSWAGALSANADILLYGCNVAADATGKAFVNLLAQATGADVAASDDLTGNAALGGDWDLEFQVGQVALDVMQRVPGFQEYTGLFALDAALESARIIAPSPISVSAEAIDAKGNIYRIGGIGAQTVDFDPGVGVVNLTSEGRDLFIQKLDANNNLLWVKQWDLNPTGTDSVEASKISIDANENVYISGSFKGSIDFNPGTEVSNLTSPNADFIEKLDASGSFLWAKQLELGYSNLVDKSGNVYLTSASSASKLDTDGNLTWVKQFATTVDRTPILTTGAFFVDATGVRLSTSRLDVDGNVYLTINGLASDVEISPGKIIQFPRPGVLPSTPGSNGYYSSAEYEVLLNTSGELIGTSQYPVLNYSGLGSTIGAELNPLNPLMDGSGNIVSISGTKLSKTNQAGEKLWIAELPAISTSRFLPMLQDASGNTYIFDRARDGRNTGIFKVSATGQVLWNKQFSSNREVRINDVKFDAAGNVYTVGSFRGTTDMDPGAGNLNFVSQAEAEVGYGNDIFINKLDSNGQLVWAKQIGGAGNDVATKLRLDALGNVHVEGTFNDVVDFDPGVGTTNLGTLGKSERFNLTLKQVDNTVSIVTTPEAVTVNPITQEITINSPNPTTGQTESTALTYGSEFGQIAGQTVVLEDKWKVIEKADLNRDGVTDVVLHSNSKDEAQVWRVNAAGQLISSQSVKGQNGQTLKTGRQDWDLVGTADADKDGILDLVWRNQTTDETAFWFMQADGITVKSYDYLRGNSGEVVKTYNPNWKIIDVSDFDGDGSADILFSLPESNQTAIARLKDKTFVDFQYIASRPDANSVLQKVADINSDGIADISWRNTSNGQVTVQTLKFESKVWRGDDFKLVDDLKAV